MNTLLSILELQGYLKEGSIKQKPTSGWRYQQRHRQKIREQDLSNSFHDNH